jgi:hypothetical protein
MRNCTVIEHDNVISSMLIAGTNCIVWGYIGWGCMTTHVLMSQMKIIYDMSMHNTLYDVIKHNITWDIYQLENVS